MSQKHFIKLTENEAVLKCYINNAGAGTIDLDPATELTRPNEVYDAATSRVSIKSIYWGTKSGKHIDITRIVPTTAQYPGDTEWDVTGVHSHYFLLDAGFYEYKGFVDNVYSKFPIRMIGDGPFHVVLVLGKVGWKNKIETAFFGPYDDVNQVGS